MTATDIQAISEMASAFLAAAGLIMVAVQLRSLTRSINGNSSAQVYTYINQLLLVQIEHPELRAYVYGGKLPPVDGIQADKVAAFLGAFADFIEFVSVQRKLGTLTEREHLDTWEPFLKKLLLKSPGLRDFILGNEGFYAPDIEELAKKCRPKPDLDVNPR